MNASGLPGPRSRPGHPHHRGHARAVAILRQNRDLRITLGNCDTKFLHIRLGLRLSRHFQIPCHGDGPPIHQSLHAGHRFSRRRTQVNRTVTSEVDTLAPSAGERIVTTGGSCSVKAAVWALRPLSRLARRTASPSSNVSNTVAIDIGPVVGVAKLCGGEKVRRLVPAVINVPPNQVITAPGEAS
jgi:hypothetical protein